MTKVELREKIEAAGFATKQYLTKYGWNITIGFDQFCNALFGPLFNLLYRFRFEGPFGDPDMTISGAIGVIKREHDGVIPWNHPVAKSVDYLLDKIDPNHSIDAIEEDEGKDSLFI